MSELLTGAVLAAMVASAIRLAVPFLLAALGEMLGQRSGVLNLGVEGIMLLGAYGAYVTILTTGNLWLGVVVGIGVGIVLGVASAVLAVSLFADQGISGIGIYLFGLGLSDLLFQKQVGTPRPIASFPRLEIPVLSDIPVLGEMLFSHNILTYLAFALVPVLAVVVNRTTYGTRVRAVGENPEAADSVGVSVTRIRYSAVTIGGTLAGLAGAALAIELGIFQQNLTSGQGFIAIALVYFGAWRPPGVLLGSLLYGLIAAAVLQGKTLGIIPRDASDLAAMIPALVTVLALVVVARRFRQPAALTKAYERGA